ncbi:VirD4-like conjugal transfer protein, CD1115 family [Paratractidigestivibacter sp.]|uniref:VirD4-like conjugal transfer protein, CD1115 family n=1 Tax=Paratractidigestivibacter sp. TaxID=2847316 RepID=UPI002AC99126|nr:type IV secretory system conjugative DNA transfer family protein [Paratractidigestivibacter sp.]
MPIKELEATQEPTYVLADEPFSPKPADRSAYQGKTLLTSKTELETDTWKTGLNNNVLVLGCSGGGKTRHHVKPNLMQAQGSYIVIDCKGSLYREVGPYLAEAGYEVDQLDFTRIGGTVGYNPIAHVRFDDDGRPVFQDIITIASAICPVEDHESDPFWPRAAANYLSAFIAYVFEALPSEEWHMGSVIRVFEQSCAGRVEAMFQQLEEENQEAYSPGVYRRAMVTCGATKMHASIMGIIAASLMPFGFPEVMGAYRNPHQVDFRSFGYKKKALFVTVNDMDRSLDRLTSMFVRQAFSALCDMADNDCADHRLPVPVRFVLDDFANLYLPNMDDVLSVIRSREISCTIICQTVSQLEARYGAATANSIIGNCDAQLVLAFQDEQTANYFAVRANKPASSLLETPAGMWWVFVRGQRGRMEPAYRLESNPHYSALTKAVARAEFEEAKRIISEWGGAVLEECR